MCRTIAAVSVAAIIVLAGCGESEPPTDYTSANRNAFLAACSRPLDDPRLLSEVCDCVYDRLELEMPFDEFVELSEALIPPETEVDGAAPSAPPATVPEEVTAIVADCFVEEADL